MRSCFFFSSPVRSVTAIAGDAAGVIRVLLGQPARMWPGCGCKLQDWWDRAVAMERKRLWHQQPAAGAQLVLRGLQVQSRQGRCCGEGQQRRWAKWRRCPQGRRRVGQSRKEEGRGQVHLTLASGARNPGRGKLKTQSSVTPEGGYAAHCWGAT